MSQVIYSSKITEQHGGRITQSVLKDTFKEAISIHKKLKSQDKRIAYFFIDPLLKSFEAANEFYFSVFECETIEKINTYKSGASPIQALTDAKEVLDHGLYDAVFIFGHEPLLTNKRLYGKEEITKAMNIFEEHSIMRCYNEMAHHLSRELGISKQEFTLICDQLFTNYQKTYSQNTNKEASMDRGKFLVEHQADLFKLTDCANPNIDFSGGIILTNENTANDLNISKDARVQLAGVSYSMIEGSPENIDKIVGKKGNLFPHLRYALSQAQSQSEINIIEQLSRKNLHLEVYTCYPPIPIGFLITTGILKDIKDLPQLLEEHEITITGGMSLARAPWNNPALNAIIDMYQKLKSSKQESYGLVHGNGGIGEIQGVAILAKV